MKKKSFKEFFIKFCEDNNFEKNSNQLQIIDMLVNFISTKKNFLSKFYKTEVKYCFYLFGNVGVGKTMILDLFYKFIDIPKKRMHFNQFMINFHDYRHMNNNDSIYSYAQQLKKRCDLIYLDELQVTNIVDAMILGKLFETMFKEKIKILITSNIKIDDLYKDGLQREQFLPFISLLNKNSIHKELLIEEDYRRLSLNKLQKAFYPLNENTTFKINKLYREFTKNKKIGSINLNIKGRKFVISEYYEGIAKFDFKELCDANVGAEDFIKIAEVCKLIVIINIPNFNSTNINQQQRFITLIDVFYEKKIYLMISMESSFDKIGSSHKLERTFKRTLSRLIELTAFKNNLFSEVV